MLNNGMVEVRYIDYGNTECSPRESLKQISDELMTLPPQAVFCGLEGGFGYQNTNTPLYFKKFCVHTTSFVIYQVIYEIFSSYRGCLFSWILATRKSSSIRGLGSWSDVQGYIQVPEGRGRYIFMCPWICWWHQHQQEIWLKYKLFGIYNKWLNSRQLPAKVSILILIVQ